MEPLVSIIIPTYNEGKRIFNTLKIIEHYLETKNYDHEIVVVDNSSKDDTASKVEDFIIKNKAPIKFIQNKRNMGKGYSVRRGGILKPG